jgi:hypothetical protein
MPFLVAVPAFGQAQGKVTVAVAGGAASDIDEAAADAGPWPRRGWPARRSGPCSLKGTLERRSLCRPYGLTARARPEARPYGRAAKSMRNGLNLRPHCLSLASVLTFVIYKLSGIM